ncbi:MAG: AAA family ATPase [Chlamydiae bacterium]|nr:AAA family ATPase [Chlamydiota bacterium]
MRINSDYLSIIPDVVIKNLNATYLLISTVALSAIGWLIYDRFSTSWRWEAEKFDLTNNLEEALKKIVGQMAPSQAFSFLKSWMAKNGGMGQAKEINLEKPTSPYEWFNLLKNVSITPEELIEQVDQIPFVADQSGIATQSTKEKTLYFTANGVEFINKKMDRFYALLQPPQVGGSILTLFDIYKQNLPALFYLILAPQVFKRIWAIAEPILKEKFHIPDAILKILGMFGIGSLKDSITYQDYLFLDPLEGVLGTKATLFGATILLFLLYHLSYQTIEGLRNLTQEMENQKIPFRGLHLLSSFQNFFRELQLILSGKEKANFIIWGAKEIFQNEVIHSLAELMCLGKAEKFGLPPMQIMLFDYRDLSYKHTSNAKLELWQQLVSKIKSQGNILLHIQNMDLSNINYDLSSLSNNNDPRIWIVQSIEKGDVRCIFTINKEEKENLEKSGQLKNLLNFFAFIEAPHIDLSEAKKLISNYFNPPDIHMAKLTPNHAEMILNMADRLKGKMEEHELISTFIRLLQSLISAAEMKKNEVPVSIKNNTAGKEELEKYKKEQEILRQITPLSKELTKARKLKEELFREWVKLRKEGKKSDKITAKAKELLLLYHVLIPLYGEKIEEEEKKLELIPHKIEKEDLILQFQAKFNTLLAPAQAMEFKKLQRLKEKLGEAIFGQDLALKEIQNAISNWRIAPQDHLQKPGLVLFFSGPPGFGKSETATLLTKIVPEMYGLKSNGKNNPYALRIYMPNNINEKHQEELMEEIKNYIQNYPTSFVILEEFDKVPPEYANKFLELFGETPINRTEYNASTNKYISEQIDRRNVIFILTSNLGQEELNDLSIKNPQDRFLDHQKKINEFVKDRYGKAFKQRINATIPFSRTEAALIKEPLNRLIQTLKENFTLSYDEKLIDYFDQIYREKKMSIREINDEIHKQVTQLITPLLEGNISEKKKIALHLTVDNDQLTFIEQK